MHSFLQFLQSDHMMAFIIAVLIFLVTILLVVKRWIGFSITLLLLVFSLAAGLAINNQQAFQGYMDDYRQTRLNERQQDVFKKQVLQAVEDLRIEVNSEKENLRQAMSQVQEIFDRVERQKQKLQNFIEETRERFKSEMPASKLEGSSSSQKEDSPSAN
ncbi:hypothetical protein [Candidatus Protochlamydia phocaeensis]|uniref:hypothetical protein n=1 Tax=Candidatus Protochlamydia phocaeensis TaxID=1414722 RepID=UPI0008391EE5|nr:hypothetical protein [Candidatus Protochlamydia phocaeensis]